MTVPLAACAGDGNPVRDVFVGAGLGAERKSAPDFVEGSRRGKLDYTPVGVSAPPRAIRAKTQAEVKMTEAEMDALRTGNEAQAAAARQAGATPPAQAPAVEPPPPLAPAPSR